MGILGGGTLKEGEGSLGVFELYGRKGVAPRLEVGARTTGFIAVKGIVIGALMVEGKYQLIPTRPLVAVGMGVSYYALEFNSRSFTTVGLYPAVWIGSPRLFVGTRMILVTMGTTDSDKVGTGSLLGITIGGRLGEQLSIRPELTLYAPLDGEESPLIIGGLGLSFRL